MLVSQPVISYVLFPTVKACLACAAAVQNFLYCLVVLLQATMLLVAAFDS